MNRHIKILREDINYRDEVEDLMLSSLGSVGLACEIHLGEEEFQGIVEFGCNLDGKYYPATYWQPAEYPEMTLYPIVRIHKEEIEEYNLFAKEEDKLQFNELIRKVKIKDIHIKMCLHDFTIANNELIIEDEDIEEAMIYEAQMDTGNENFYIW